MRKAFIAIVVLALAGFTVASGSGSVAKASNGAVVINDQGCVFFDGDGGFVTTDTDHSVIINNGHGLFTCKASGVANSTGKAANYDANNNPLGFLVHCGQNLTGQLTADWNETVSASGEATLRCHFSG